MKDKLHILLGLSADLARERDLRPILAKLTDVTKLLLDADRCSIFLHDEKSDELWTIVAHGIEEIRIPAHAGIAGESFSQSQTISIEDAYKDSRFKQEIDMHTGYRTKSILAMPLCNVSDGHPIGVFQVINKLSGTTFTSEDVDLLSHVSLYASSTIEGALLNERLRRAHRDVIYKLSSATKFKDPETQNHIIRVGLYCAAIAQKLGWSEEQIETIRLAAPMHDIGKVGIPDAILQKPGPLTEDEWIIMRKHTEYGYNILDGSDSSLLAMAKELALDHHEKWDGSGYPNNKSGDKISLAGRITALADVFDALTSPRHYKPAWTTPRVTAHIAEQNGKHFDPDLTVIFLNNIDIMTKIRAEWQDPELIVTTVAPA